MCTRIIDGEWHQRVSEWLLAYRGRGRRPVFVASAADKKAREFPEILSEGLIAIIIVEWVEKRDYAKKETRRERTISGIQSQS